MTIYDDIPIIQDPAVEDIDSSFLGYNTILTLTKNAREALNNEKNAEQKNWMLTEVEAIIKKAAEEGKWLISITVPAQYDLDQCRAFLQKAGYEVRPQGNRNLMISWQASTISIKIEPQLYNSLDHYYQIWSEGSVDLPPVDKGIHISEIRDQIPQTIEYIATSYNLFTGNREELTSNGPAFDLLSDFNFLVTNTTLRLPYISATHENI